MQHNFDRNAVRDAVLELADAVTSDGQYDPSDDPRPEMATRRLTDLIGNVRATDIAEGIAAALQQVMEQ